MGRTDRLAVHLLNAGLEPVERGHANPMIKRLVSQVMGGGGHHRRGGRGHSGGGSMGAKLGRMAERFLRSRGRGRKR